VIRSARARPAQSSGTSSLVTISRNFVRSSFVIGPSAFDGLVGADDVLDVVARGVLG
jgi:hypothetical protein